MMGRSIERQNSIIVTDRSEGGGQYGASLFLD